MGQRCTLCRTSWRAELTGIRRGAEQRAKGRMSTPVVCHRCGEAVDEHAAAVRAYERVVVAPESQDVPDLRGPEAIFHQACAPAWGDPDWISRAEGPLDELTPP